MLGQFNRIVGQCSVETIGSIFANASREASSNYGIGYDGKIGLYGVACVNTNRKFLDERYFEVAKNRINEAIEKKNQKNIKRTKNSFVEALSTRLFSFEFQKHFCKNIHFMLSYFFILSKRKVFSFFAKSHNKAYFCDMGQ